MAADGEAGKTGLSDKAYDLEALRASVADAAAVSGPIWFSYLTVFFYFAISAGAVTHRDLFMENPVRLPFLTIELPLTAFFFLTPILFVIVHTYVLLHFSMLVGKVRAFDQQLRKEVADAARRDEVRRQLPTNVFVQVLAGPGDSQRWPTGFLLQAIAWISLVFGPIMLLGFLLLQFLPYQDARITWAQRSMVLLDLLLLSALWPRLALRDGIDNGGVLLAWLTRRPARALQWLTAWNVAAWRRPAALRRPWMLAMWLVSLWVMLVACFPGEDLYGLAKNVPMPGRRWLVEGELKPISKAPASWFSNRLVLPDFDAIDHAKLDTEDKIVAASVTISVRGRNLIGANFDRAVLRKVDFVGAVLSGAGRAASFVQADLRGAKLGCADPPFESICAQLQDVSMVKAQLQGAQLKGAKLQGAVFVAAQMDGSVLNGTELQGARLVSAHLQGASMNEAGLQGASLQWADIRGASLDGADLRGASLDKAQLQGASLNGAKLQGASLDLAQRQGASLNRAQLQGASLYGAGLQGASLRDAQLQGASLYVALLWRSDARGAATAGSRLTDVDLLNRRQGTREYPVDVERPWSFRDFSDLEDALRMALPPGPARNLALQRISSLDPDAAVDGEADILSDWVSRLTRRQQGDEFLRTRSAILRDLGCSPEHAPYVLAGLSFNFKQQTTTEPRGKVAIAALAADFLKADCSGNKGLSKGKRDILSGIANRQTN